MKKLIIILLLVAIIAIPVSGQTDIFHKNGKRGSEITVTSVNAMVEYVHPEGMKITQLFYVDAAPMTVNFNSQSATKETWGTGNGQGNSDVLVEHDFDATVNDTLKCTITLKSPHELYFPYTTQNGVSLVEAGNGNLKFVRDATGSYDDRYKPGVLVSAPIAWNKTGGAVPVWYTFTSSQINLNINDAGQEYPITIDPTLIPDIPLGYANVTSFTYNITPGYGAQTNYQMKFILSNASGISGYYSPDNVIFTNGTTRPDWNDVNATDGSSTPLSFWIETNTQTAKNTTAWVRVPIIAIDNTSTAKWYYGNASQTESAMDGLNTFPFFDDFNGASLNTTKWSTVASTTATVASGAVTIATTQVAGGGINGTTPFGQNYSVVSRWRQTATPSASYPAVGFFDVLTNHQNTAIMFAYDQVASNKFNFQSQNAGTTTNSQSAIAVDTSYHVFSVKRIPGNVIGTIDNANTVTITTNLYTGTLFPGGSPWDSTSNVVTDWFFVRKVVSIEPTTSLYSTASTGGTPPTAAFTQSANPSSTGQAVTFTDTSTGSPTTWNWTINGVITNTTQNIAYTFTTAGTYYVDLNVTNSSGSFSNITHAHTVVNASGFTPQDIWMEGQFLQTFHITDSSTGLPITTVDLTLSPGGSTYTTTNGTGYLTTGFGAYTVTFISEGYVGKTISYVFDEDATWDVQMVALTTGGQQNTWYTPKQISITVVSYYPSGKKIPDAHIDLKAIGNSLQADTQLQTIYGINPDAANEMLNGTLLMNSNTSMDGVAVFTVLASINYVANVTDPSTGRVWTTPINPGLDPYTIWIGDKPNAVNTTEIDSLNQTKLWPSQPDVGNWTLNMQYRDITGKTTDVRFIVKTAGNLTEIYNVSLGNPGTSLVLANHTHRNIIGEGYYYYWKATRV